MWGKATPYDNATRHYRAGRYKEAIYWYTAAIASRPHDADLFADRAVAYIHAGDLREALTDLDRARELEPQNPYRYASRAYVRDAMGDVEGAVADYRHAIALDPEDAVAHNNLGLLEEKLGRGRQAKVLFDLADALAAQHPEPGAEPTARPQNIQRHIDRTRRARTMWSEMMSVFTSRAAFDDFLTFVRNGFR